jgi:hypothetical protein
MPAKGQTRRFRDVRGMSGPLHTADISGPDQHFAFVPYPDIPAFSLEPMGGVISYIAAAG